MHESAVTAWTETMPTSTRHSMGLQGDSGCWVLAGLQGNEQYNSLTVPLVDIIFHTMVVT